MCSIHSIIDENSEFIGQNLVEEGVHQFLQVEVEAVGHQFLQVKVVEVIPPDLEVVQTHFPRPLNPHLMVPLIEESYFHQYESIPFHKDVLERGFQARPELEWCLILEGFSEVLL